ncbi:hypothetical protein GYMLUDRAFT_857740 [Collybiopsis luxurians FD-317 M1]|nr:hypothetical protein GYMLUDRAFT_857740 [Collybiopsis luxurians FD-317 M1]
MSAPKPFTVSVSLDLLDWIHDRIHTARIIPDLDRPSGEEWEDGTPSSEMKRLVNYWRTEFDWKCVERRLNDTYRMFTLDLEEAGEVLSVHFVHQRSERPGAIPLLFLHGWPGNFTEVEGLLELVNPTDMQAQAFHIVAPSLPGFAFSSSPTKPGFSAERMGSLFHKLMNALGYSHYVGQGGDIGAFILRSMAIQHPDHCVGIHLNFIMSPPPSVLKSPATLLWLILKWFTPDQRKRIQRMQWWIEKQFGYAQIQGLLAWIREKLNSMVDPEFVWNDETIIMWVMLYLVSGSAGHARIYKASFQYSQKEIFDNIVPRKVAVGVSQFAWDTAYLPQWWAEVCVAEEFVLWKEHQSGGHFASTESGKILAQDVSEFITKIPSERRRPLYN